MNGVRPTIAAGVVLLGTAGLVALGAGTASADTGADEPADDGGWSSAADLVIETEPAGDTFSDNDFLYAPDNAGPPSADGPTFGFIDPATTSTLMDGLALPEPEPAPDGPPTGEPSVPPAGALENPPELPAGDVPAVPPAQSVPVPEVPGPAEGPADPAPLAPAVDGEVTFGVTDPATTAVLTDRLRLPVAGSVPAGTAPGMSERTTPLPGVQADRPPAGLPLGGVRSRPQPAQPDDDGASSFSDGSVGTAGVPSRTGAGGRPARTPQLPVPTQQVPIPPGEVDKPWVSFELDPRLVGAFDPDCQADPDCAKAQFSIPPTAYGYALAGVPPTIGVTAAVQYTPPSAAGPGVPMGTAFRNGGLRAPFGFAQDILVGGAIGNVPLFRDPNVDKVAKTAITSTVVTLNDVGLRAVVNPAIDRWAAANAAKVPLARVLSGGGIRTDSGLKPGPLAAIPVTVNAGLAAVDAIEEFTGFGKVTPEDESNLDYYRDIGMRAGAVGVGVGGPVAYNILKTGGDKRLIPLPFLLPALQSGLSQVALGPEPPHPDGFTRFLRGGAQVASSGLAVVGDVATGLDRAVLGDADAEDGNTMNLLRAGGNLAKAVFIPTVEMAGRTLDPIRPIGALVDRWNGRPAQPLISPESEARVGDALDRTGRTVRTGLRVAPTNAADAAASTAGNSADGLGDALIGGAHWLAQVADPFQTPSSRALDEPTQAQRAAYSLTESRKSFQRASNAAQTFIDTGVKPVLQAGFNLLGCGSIDCPPASPALTCDTGAWIACPGSPGHPAGQPRVGSKGLGPDGVGPPSVPNRVGPKVVGPKVVGPKVVGRGLVGPKTVGPKVVGPRLVGPAKVGQLYVGNGSGTPIDRAWTGLQNLGTGRPIREAVAGPMKAVQDVTAGPIKAVETFVKDPVGTVTRGWRSLFR